ncbi:MAG: GIY-YIG nuclease family protein [Bacteroidia bacterium]|jgi:putative endonuclease
MFTVYVIYSQRAKLKYTGYTCDLERRLNEHNNNLLSTFTKKKGPWELIYKEEFATRAEAVEREKYLKTGFGRALIKRRTGK